MAAQLAWALLLVAAAQSASPADGQVQGAASARPREVSITSDSAPGWIPSAQLEAQAFETAKRYWAAIDAGDFDAGYALMTPAFRTNINAASFKANEANTASLLGHLTGRTIVKITWTSGSAQAPTTGTYAAIDISARYAKAARFCGFIILYQPTTADEIYVARVETNFMRDESYSKFASTAAADAAWAATARNCPNYTPAQFTP